MKDPASLVSIIRVCFDGVTQLSFVALATYVVRSSFHYLEARLATFGPEPFAVRRCPECQREHLPTTP